MRFNFRTTTNANTISKHLPLTATIAILVLALISGISTSVFLFQSKTRTTAKLQSSNVEIENLKKNIASAQDDIAKKQSEINRLENDQ